MNIKLNIVNDYDLLLNKGDGLVIPNPELGYEQLIIICPACGKITAPKGTLDSNGKHKFDKKTLSVKFLTGCPGLK